MKLATLTDGSLVVVSEDLAMAVKADGIIPTLQQAVENWQGVHNELDQVYGLLCAAEARDAFALSMPMLAAPLPNMPLAGASALDATQFHASFAVVTDAVPMGVAADQANNYIRLIMLTATLAGQQPVAAPIAVSLDALGDAWQGGSSRLPITAHYSNDVMDSKSIEVHASFAALIADAARAQALLAGTVIVASPSVSATLPAASSNGVLRIEALDVNGKSMFGAIEFPTAPHAPAT